MLELMRSYLTTVINSGVNSCAGYNATPIFKEGHFIDLEGLDKTAERVVNFLLKEQPEGNLSGGL